VAVGSDSTKNEEVGRWRTIAGANLVAAALLACNAITGAGDLEVGCVDGCDGGEPDRAAPAVEDAFVDMDSTVDAPVPTDGGTDAPRRPTFCEGITLYLPFDGSLNAKSGQTPDAPPTIPFVPGKFGQAADLTLAGGVAIYYAATYNAKPSYSLSQGSVAMWLKPTWQPPCTAASVLFKPRALKANTSPNAGPVVECGSLLGLTVDEPDGGLVSVGYPSAAVPNWKPADWNHVVGTWGASSPTLRFSLNGAPPLATSAPWAPNESPVNFLRIGSESSAPRSLYDEVIFWTRTLSAAEISELASSTVSAGVACGL
jgi:Concanavalin A-like lectin/glucanases superfamily